VRERERERGRERECVCVSGIRDGQNVVHMFTTLSDTYVYFGVMLSFARGMLIQKPETGRK